MRSGSVVLDAWIIIVESDLETRRVLRILFLVKSQIWDLGQLE